LIILLNPIPDSSDVCVYNTVIDDFNIIARKEFLDIAHRDSFAWLFLHSYILNKLSYI